MAAVCFRRLHKHTTLGRVVGSQQEPVVQGGSRASRVDTQQAFVFDFDAYVQYYFNHG